MKKTRIFCIREHGYLLNGGTSNSHNLVSIPNSAFISLLTELHDEDAEDIQPFLKLATYKRKPALKVQNYVGVLRTPCGTQIEILPKLYNQSSAIDSIEKARNQLLTMLRTLRNSPFKNAGRADIRDAKMPLLEVYITQFLSMVNQLVKRGVRSDYISVTKNAKYLKGRLMIAQQLRKNAFHQERFYIEYQEYQINRPANRLIKSTLELINKYTRISQNQRLARELSFVFDEVPKSQDFKEDFQKVKVDRTMTYYSEVLAWCQLLLANHGPTVATGKLNTLTLLYPMERIFEDYVAHCLRKNLNQYFEPGCHLKTQSSKYSLVEHHNGKPIFRLKPDLLLQLGQESICVMDTKWKLLNSNDRSHKYGISQADIYQLYAYGHKYLKGTEEKKLMLIYPKTDTFTQALPTFTYEDGFTLQVVPFNISKGELLLT